MNISRLCRRDFLRLSISGSLLGLSGCLPSSQKAFVSSVDGFLPKEVFSDLPKPWKFRPLQVKAKENPFTSQLDRDVDLIALSDGWLSALNPSDLHPIKLGKLTSRLSTKAQTFIQSLGPTLSNKVFPIGLSPWVMLFRNGEAWLDDANDSWNVLLDKRLNGEIIFPRSPRLVISIAEKITKPDSLNRLIRQSKAFDDRNALNWVLSGKARVAVLPLHRCTSSLFGDPRLSVALPREGAPLDWSLFVRPISSDEPIPALWLEKIWDIPLIIRLISRGWIPPVSYLELSKTRKFFSEDSQRFLLPSADILNKSWSFPPLSTSEETSLENYWNNSIP